ncbi:MAG: 6-carboxytetrahydropterin synthase [Planctomycetes bacterium]|nr:6-carboxytetrahydropterin synthase [Planctomycetota bacterium]
MSRFELTLIAEFSAAHQLRLLDGRMEPLHGHNWQVEVYISGERLDGIDVLADFTILQPQLREITGSLHDSFLNDHPAFNARNPSTELVAKFIHDQFAPKMPPGVGITKVCVWETRDCAAAFVP